MIEDEQQLIELAKRGNADAFGALYDQYMPQIYRFALLRMGSQEEAEDLTHEVFVHAWQKIPTYEERGFPLTSWLYQIARNRIIDHFRTKKIELPIDEQIGDHDGIDEELGADVDATLALAKVKDAIAQLGGEQQTVLIMRFVEDRSTREVAHTLGKTEGAIRLIQHRALRALRDILVTEV